MELQVTQENLTRALANSGRVASGKTGLPVLANILLRTDNNRLLVASTNLEVASTSYIGAKVAKPGSITVPARLIGEFVANLPKAPIDISVKGTRLTLSSGGYTSTINGIDADEFPELPTIDEKTSVHYSFGVDDFKQATNQVLFACSNDATRPVLTGIFWHSNDGSLYLAGTDGYRLAERKLIDTTSELAAIVPASTMLEVLRTIHDGVNDIEVLFDETQVRFRVGESEITSRLIDGKYPDYRQLIPKSTETQAKVATSDLVRTAKIAGLFARETGGSITVSADEEKSTLAIQSVASEVGDNSSTIDATVVGGGSVSLNSRYLSEVLSIMDAKEVNFNFSGKLAPIVLTPDTADASYTHIIMPLKS